MNKKLKFTTIGILFCILVWWGLSILVEQPFLLPTPYECVLSLIDLLKLKIFYFSLLNTIFRVFLVLLFSLLLGIIFGYISSRSENFRYFISPIFSFISSSPIVALIFVILVFVSSKFMPLVVGMLTITPISYERILSELMSIDKNLLEMTYVFKISLRNRIRYLEFPIILKKVRHMMSYLIAFSFKTCVSGEVLSGVNGSLGNIIYSSKINLETSKLLAVILVIILVSKLFERIFRV